jgi:hypothetical protein
MNTIFPPDYDNSTFTRGEQSSLPTIDDEGRPISQTADEMHRAGSQVIPNEPTISNFQNSAVSGIGGHSVCGAAHEIVPPASLPTPGGGAGSPAPPARASAGLGSSAYSTGLEGFDK